MNLCRFFYPNESCRERYSNLHGVSIADVFAGGLNDRFAGLVQGPVDTVVCPRVGLLDQGLELREREIEGSSKTSTTTLVANVKAALPDN